MTPINSKPKRLPSTAPTIVAVLDFWAACKAVETEVLVEESSMDVMTDVPIVMTTAEEDAGAVVRLPVVGALLEPPVESVEVFVVDEVAPDDDEDDEDDEDVAVLDVVEDEDVGDVVEDELPACVTVTVEDPPIVLDGTLEDVVVVGLAEVTTA